MVAVACRTRRTPSPSATVSCEICTGWKCEAALVRSRTTRSAVAFLKTWVASAVSMWVASARVFGSGCLGAGAPSAGKIVYLPSMTNSAW